MLTNPFEIRHAFYFYAIHWSGFEGLSGPNNYMWWAADGKISVSSLLDKSGTNPPTPGNGILG